MPNQPVGPIKLFVLGDARIETPKGIIEPKAEVVFATALYLVLHEEKSVSRRSLERILWPNAEPHIASHRLRQTLLKIKKAGITFEPQGKTKLKILSHSVETDFHNLRVASALELPPTLKILAGYEPSFSEEFAEWVDQQRAEIGTDLTPALLSVIHQHRSLGEWSEVQRAAEALREVSQFNEEASLALAEALAMRGAKLDAIAILDSYLREVGSENSDLRIQATLLRKRIVGRQASANHQSAEAAFVGRSSSLREIGDQLRSAKHGSGQARLVLGDAGIGKSRLLQELSGFAALQGFTVQRIQCRPSHKSQPLSAFVELVPMLRNMRGAIGCSPETLAELDRLTRHRPIDAHSRLEDNDGQWAYGRILRALFDIVDAIAEESPLFIQFEDVHWLDSTSSEVLGDMIQWSCSRKLFFGLTGRQRPDHWLIDPPPLLAVTQLAPLDDRSSEALLRDIAEHFGKMMDEDCIGWCLRVAEGNPYFLQELATHWAETHSYHELPPSLSAVLGSRVDRLDRDSLQVLQTCSLLENNSSLERLEKVLAYEPHRLLSSINTLGTAGMMVVELDDTKGTKDRVMSRHELLSNVALSRLSTPARAFLHRRIGQILEQEVDEHFSTSILWDCAKHWQLAGDSERALALGLSCARHLLKVGLSKAAGEAFERCMPFCRSDRHQLDVLEGEALAHYRVSDWLRVRETAALARTIKDRLQPTDTHHDDLELMDLRADWQSLRWEEISARALDCLASVQAEPRHRVEGGIMAMMLLGYQGNKPEVAITYATIEELIRTHALGLALEYQSQMVFHTGFGDLRRGVSAARQLIAEQNDRGNIAEIFRAYCNAAVTFRVAGLFEDAEQSLMVALDHAERYGLDQSVVRVLPLLANMALERGQIDVARRWHSRLAELTVHPSNRFGLLELGGIGARLALINDDGHAALRVWSVRREDAQSDSIYHRRTYNCAIQTGIDLSIDDRPNRETLNCLLDAYEHSKTGMHQAFSVCIIHAALIRQGKRKEADRIFDSYAKTHRREPWPVPSHLIDCALALGQGINQQAAARA